uniref:Uncharacterized protein n=1 Tax=Lactuca sativa TaxID=4236 RepID=A0A9R1WI97_LACSA|nr:hypothetical protein LSAT_V11C100016440 [Lactuca sativa]
MDSDVKKNSCVVFSFEENGTEVWKMNVIFWLSLHLNKIVCFVFIHCAHVCECIAITSKIQLQAYKMFTIMDMELYVTYYYANRREKNTFYNFQVT